MKQMIKPGKGLLWEIQQKYYIPETTLDSILELCDEIVFN